MLKPKIVASYETNTPVPLFSQHVKDGNAPLVSVICATFNQCDFVTTCLDSILAQETNFPVEIIVHDDLSTDGTADVILHYASRFPDIIRPIIRKSKLYSATKKVRLELLNYARGDYVAICDGDDFWRDTGKLQKQVTFLSKRPHLSMSYHQACIVDKNGAVISPSIRKVGYGSHYDAAALRSLESGWLPLPTILHRNLPLEYPPEFDLAPNSDNFLLILLAPHGGAGFQHDIKASALRRHDNNIFSASSDDLKRQKLLQTYFQIAGYLLRKGEVVVAIQFIKNKLYGALRSMLPRQRFGAIFAKYLFKK